MRLRRPVAVTGLLVLIGVAGTATGGAASASTSRRPHVSLSSYFSAVDGSYAAGDDAESLFNLTAAVGARSMWLRGTTGDGVSVGVIDSGIADVPGLEVTPGVDLSSTAGTSASGDDGFGHGTAMAGIIGGHDRGSLLFAGPDDFNGVAPDASLVNIKVAEANGWTDPSRIIAGIAWAIQHKNDAGRPPIRVLNLSYGTASRQGYKADPVAYAAEQAWKAGIVVVASAGNDGSADGRLLDPAMDPFVIAVGAATSADGSAAVAPFSSQGDGTRNPDVLAPGVSVETLRSPGSLVDSQVPAPDGASRFVKGSGTSEAAAMVSGMAALLLSEHPNLTPDQVKGLLTGTAESLPGQSAAAQGHGLVDVAAAGRVLFPARATQTFAPSQGNGSLDASRGNDSWVAAGASSAQAENPALMGGASGATWAGRAWSGRTWSGASWAADGSGSGLCGRSWSGRSWS